MFACLRCDQYTVANIQNLHVLTYHRDESRLPFAALLRHDVGLFSEEAGEVSFSLLARSTLGDSVEDKHKFMRDCFCGLGAMRTLVQQDAVTAEKNHGANTSRTRIRQTDPEVLALEQHFLGVLRSLGDGSFSYYASSQTLKKGARFNGGWTNAISPRLSFSPEAQLDKVWHKVSDLDRDWGQQFAEQLGFILPERGGSPCDRPESPLATTAVRQGRTHRPKRSISPEWGPSRVSSTSRKPRKARSSYSPAHGNSCFS